MNKTFISYICHIYILLILVAMSILTHFPYSVFSGVLFLVIMFVTFRPVKPQLSIVVSVEVLFIIPLLVENSIINISLNTSSAILLQLITAVVILPITYILDYHLRQNAQDVTFVSGTQKMYISPVLKIILVTIPIIILVSLFLGKYILLAPIAVLVLYLLVMLTWFYRTVRILPVGIPDLTERVIAGTTAEITLSASSRLLVQLHCLLSPVDSWIEVTPDRFTLNNKEIIKLNITVTPPLAGPKKPRFLLSTIDPCGLVQVNHTIEPLTLTVIPRAKYAEWLAKRFLEKTGTGSSIVGDITSDVTFILKRGIEYVESRDYQPGDLFKDMDWKHSLKLNKWIVKKFSESGEQSVIYAVNLSVTTADEADKLAFDMITTALTLAYEAIPAALVVYNHNKIVTITDTIESREILKQTLSLVKDITYEELPSRFLQLPDTAKLRRNISLLKQVESPSGKQLLSLLEFESRVIEETAKHHPATLALLNITSRIPAPALLVLVSKMNHDAEALLSTTRRLSSKGYSIEQIM